MGYLLRYFKGRKVCDIIVAFIRKHFVVEYKILEMEIPIGIGFYLSYRLGDNRWTTAKAVIRVKVNDLIIGVNRCNAAFRLIGILFDSYGFSGLRVFENIKWHQLYRYVTGRVCPALAIMPSI